MKTKQLQPVTTGTYGLTSVQALLSYANHNPVFAAWFAEQVRQSGVVRQTHDSRTTLQQSILTLRDEYHATRRALWLLHVIPQRQIRGHELAKQVLASWVHEQEQDARQFIILGLKYGILDYGIIGYPKRRNEPMHVLIRENVAKESHTSAIAQVCTKLSSNIVEQGLMVAKGNAHHLEPELSDWLFGDKHLVIFTSQKSTLKSIHNLLVRDDVPLSCLHDAQGITHLAISPTVYLPQIPGYEKLTLLT